MIELICINGCAYVFKVEHWEKLRKNYRIIGALIGNTNILPSLPLKLLPEEVFLLLELGAAKLVKKVLNSESKLSTKEFEEKLIKYEQIEYKEVRRQQLELMIDSIVENLRKSGDNRSKDDIFKSELDKSCIIDKNNMIWPILLEKSAQTIPVENVNLIKFNCLKNFVFKDLWEKGYTLTDGQKFGGDFLVYLGDPLIFHAIFIIKCVESRDTIRPKEIVAFGRLGTSVKKKAVYATVNKENKVEYITLSWLDA